MKDEKNMEKFVNEMEGNQTKDATITINSETSKVQSTGIQPTSGLKGIKTKDERDYTNSIGWEKLKNEDLPTQGLFYPEGTEIVIRAATGAEIRHWSTLDEDDLSILDDMLNFVIERCANIKFPKGTLSSWKDIKEVDRFYILLAIRERTFVNGENQLQVKISEADKLDVTKNMIDYITFDDRLMRYYDNEKRCIFLKFKNGNKLEVHLASVGVTNWLKKYVQRKARSQEPFDKDFLNFAPFVIGDWRGLSDESYEHIVMQSQSWTTSEISMLTKIRQIFADTINPVVKYKDENGGDRVLPLNFLGGIKSLFLISDPFSELT